MTNTSSALVLIYLQRTVLFCLGLASCLPLMTRILTIRIISPLLSRPTMNTHHVPQHTRSHVASVLNSHLTSKPSTSITWFSSPSIQVRKLQPVAKRLDTLYLICTSRVPIRPSRFRPPPSPFSKLVTIGDHAEIFEEQH